MAALRIATLLIALALAACGAPTTASPQPAPQLPPGYRLFDGGPLGFQIGLAPDWEQAGDRAPDGVNFTDPSRRGAMLVHFGRAQTRDLNVAAGAVMFDLTGGSGAVGGSQTSTTLAGRPAREIRGSFYAAGASQQIEAVVMMDGDVAWVLALAGPPERLAADQADFDQMRSTFRLLANRPSPPARVALGQPAPDFPELAKIKGPVVLNFFATWCAPCREEMPLLAQRAKTSQGRFTVLVVNTQDDATKVPGFMKELGITLTLGYDRDGRLTEAYLLPGVPATFFLDSKHVVRNLVYGPLTSDSLATGLKAAGIS